MNGVTKRTAPKLAKVKRGQARGPLQSKWRFASALRAQRTEGQPMLLMPFRRDAQIVPAK